MINSDRIKGCLTGHAAGGNMGMTMRGKTREEAFRTPIRKLRRKNFFSSEYPLAGETIRILDVLTQNCRDAASSMTAEAFIRSLLGSPGDTDESTAASLLAALAVYAYTSDMTDAEILGAVSKTAGDYGFSSSWILGEYILTAFTVTSFRSDAAKAYEHVLLLDYSSFDEKDLRRYGKILNGRITDYHLMDMGTGAEISEILELSLWIVMVSDSFAEVIVGAVNLGGPCDLIGEIAGAAAGAAVGAGAIPRRYSAVICPMRLKVGASG